MRKQKQSKCSVFYLLPKIVQRIRLWEQAPEIRFIFQRRLQTIYKGLFTICTYLKTKESYDRWITRRLWGFRQQMSKAKYLKISQNIGGKYQEALGEHRGPVQNGCALIRVDAIR